MNKVILKELPTTKKAIGLKGKVWKIVEKDSSILKLMSIDGTYFISVRIYEIDKEV